MESSISWIICLATRSEMYRRLHLENDMLHRYKVALSIHCILHSWIKWNTALTDQERKYLFMYLMYTIYGKDSLLQHKRPKFIWRRSCYKDYFHPYRYYMVYSIFMRGGSVVNVFGSWQIVTYLCVFCRIGAYMSIPKKNTLHDVRRRLANVTDR